MKRKTALVTGASRGIGRAAAYASVSYTHLNHIRILSGI